MGSENGSGESRFDASRKGDYLDSIIGDSHTITRGVGIYVPLDAEFMAREYGVVSQVTFYRWESRRNLEPVHPSLRGKKILFEP